MREEPERVRVEDIDHEDIQAPDQGHDGPPDLVIVEDTGSRGGNPQEQKNFEEMTNEEIASTSRYPLPPQPS